MTPFERRVLTAVRRIPPGRVATYGDIAALAGRPRASRAVGNIMRGCSDGATPCHRVVAAGGGLGGYSSLQLKRELLRAEGVDTSLARVRRFAAIRWQPRGHLGAFAAPRSRRGRQAPPRKPGSLPAPDPAKAGSSS
jgi:O-6-methylguanine DNA methyltransferase